MRSHSQPASRTCLTEEVLSAFRAGLLPDPDSERRVADHLASCETCASRLSSLPHDPLSDLLRASDPLRPLIEAGQLGPIRSSDSTQAHQLSDSVPASPPERPSSARPAEELPVKLGDYFVIRELGGGSFGQVYLARDPLHQRLVALKVPRQDRFPTAESRELFLREARTVAELDHGAIVPMYDVCELPDGRCLLALKYIEGMTLQELMKLERIAPQRAAAIVARIADALDYAHRRQPGVWHRDVKPANILLDRSGLAYLTDFGLALQEDQQRQFAGQLAGTYPYMSPEQILARAEYLDGRSDIWGLGVILYELLTRQRPFRGTTYDELKHEIPQRAHRPARSVEPAVPRRLESICERCLRKDANERYATAAELARELRGAVEPRR
ncbi:MAG: serine/threonine protein kinase, partial [Pirellulaceae bacterium]|nr:serine/threonine protein kinase [Pirellulaceae bacterium]